MAHLSRAKSSARLSCPRQRRHEFKGSDIASVRRTVQVVNPDENISASGGPFGSLEHINAQVREAVDYGPTEVVLPRQCADVSKLTFHLRLNGDKVDHSLLAMLAVSPSLIGDFLTTAGGRPPLGFFLVDLGSAPRSPRPCPLHCLQPRFTPPWEHSV